MDLSTLFDSSSSGSSLGGYASAVNGVQIWSIVAMVLSVFAAILAYLLYVKSKNDYKGFLASLRDFLSFKTMYIEALAKMFYIGMTIYYILTSINYLILLGGNGIISFLTQLILYPLVIRFAYEFIMVIVKIWRNTDKIVGNKK